LLRPGSGILPLTLNPIWDVVIVGAGPAGASAARHAAAAGLRTLVLEKSPFPRPKVCAGGVTEGALREIGLPLPRELIEREARCLRPRWGSEQVKVVSSRAFVYLVSRAGFDEHLLTAARLAGAEVLFGSPSAASTCVLGIDNEAEMATVSTSGRCFRARAVIGADGVRSMVARTLRGDLGHRETGLCLAADLPTSPVQRQALIEDGIEIRYGTPTWGYGWLFPKEGRVSVGVGAIRYRPGALRPALLRHLETSSLLPPGGAGEGWDLESLRGHLRAHLVPLGGVRRPVAGGRVFLVGDAAGFADPFTGEGIRWACLSGRLAAEAVVRGLRRGRLSGQAAAYTAACRALIDRDLAWARWLTRLFGRWPERVSRLFFSRPELFLSLIDVLRGELTYRRLVLGLPARLLASGR
jgi:geranylgeranyl reductase family protein